MAKPELNLIRAKNPGREVVQLHKEVLPSFSPAACLKIKVVRTSQLIKKRCLRKSSRNNNEANFNFIFHRSMQGMLYVLFRDFCLKRPFFNNNILACVMKPVSRNIFYLAISVRCTSISMSCLLIRFVGISVEMAASQLTNYVHSASLTPNKSF